MKIDLKQGSFQWFKHRAKFVNASEIGTIMGLNPYETQEDLIKKKIFKPPFITNEAIEYGKKMEPKANLFFSTLTKLNYEPAVFTNAIFSASLDGYHEKTKTMLEIKCPMNKKSSAWKDFLDKKIISPYYYAQIQCGLYCSETQLAYFLVYFNDDEYYIEKVSLNHEFISKMKKAGIEYKKTLEKYKLLFDKPLKIEKE